MEKEIRLPSLLKWVLYLTGGTMIAGSGANITQTIMKALGVYAIFQSLVRSFPLKIRFHGIKTLARTPQRQKRYVFRCLSQWRNRNQRFPCR
jgi:hypothetical protein